MTDEAAKNVLFVDDEPNLLDALRRALRGLEGWNPLFAGSGEQALATFDQGPVDVIVSDLRMPGMDGAELLRLVQEKSPDTVRIVLSGHADANMVMKSVKQAHQFLTKPCPADEIAEVLRKAYNLRRILTDNAVKSIVSGVDTLPSVPHLYQRVTEEVQRENCSLAEVARIISEDPGMTAAILKLVNSSFFGVYRKVTNPLQAVSLLGVDIVRGLILTAHLFAVSDLSHLSHYGLETLVGHSLATGRIASALARFEGLSREAADECFIAGMLHDVGKLILASQFGELYVAIISNVRSTNRTVWEVEKEILGCSHAEIGAYLMGLWNLPGPVVDALAFHHQPTRSGDKTFSALTAVHAANSLQHASHVVNPGYAAHPMDEGYLEALGLAPHLPQWLELCDGIFENR